MIQNTRIPRFARLLTLSVSTAVLTAACSTPAVSQIVSSDAFNEPADHSILEVADDSVDNSARVQSSFSNPNTNAALTSEANEAFVNPSQFASTPPVNVSPSNTKYDAPLAPRPRLKGASPRRSYRNKSGSNTSGTFASPNETAASTKLSQLQPQQPVNRGVNSLRSSGLAPAPEDQASPSPTSTGSFRSSPASSSTEYQSSSKSATIVSDVAGSNSTAKIDDQNQGSSNTAEPKYESAYLHDQAPQATPTKHANRRCIRLAI